MSENPTHQSELTPHERRVAAMMVGFGQATPPAPVIPDTATLILRARLMLEECLEFIEAAGLSLSFNLPAPDFSCCHPGSLIAGGQLSVRSMRPPSMVEMVDGLADLSVVGPAGTALALGVRMAPILEAVDANNLMKIANGRIDEYGKFIKSPTHPPVTPVLRSLLRQQGWTDRE